jgi:hypothetical protein
MQGVWYNIFCSQKISLLVFLIGIADHVGPGDAQDRVTKGKKKKPKASLKHKTNLVVRTRFFIVPCYLFGTALTCHFVTSM